ncbi:MAG TPA: hypothetical protein VF518_11510, partial [Polyangia bacterium]
MNNPSSIPTVLLPKRKKWPILGCAALILISMIATLAIVGSFWMNNFTARIRVENISNEPT